VVPVFNRHRETCRLKTGTTAPRPERDAKGVPPNADPKIRDGQENPAHPCLAAKVGVPGTLRQVSSPWKNAPVFFATVTTLSR